MCIRDRYIGHATLRRAALQAAQQRVLPAEIQMCIRDSFDTVAQAMRGIVYAAEKKEIAVSVDCPEDLTVFHEMCIRDRLMLLYIKLI